MAKDPFTLAYDEIESTLKRYGFNKLVSWNSTRAPELDKVSSSDLPELQVRPSGFAGRIGARSCATEIQRTYQILLNTGDKRVGEFYFPYEWKLISVLHEMQYGKMNDLVYNGRKFVENVEIVGATGGLSDAIANRGIEGWTALWDIRVSMSFSEADLEVIRST